MPESTESQIGFEQVGIANVLKRHRLRVPPNQREYAWEDEHVKNLFDDLARAISEGEPTYFLGTLVTIARDNVLEVVDGQQRLATTTLLLHAIVDYLDSRDEVIAQSIRNEILFTTDRRRRELVPRLTLNLTDNDFFRLLITSATAPIPTKPSHRLLLRAQKLARERVLAIVADLNENDHGDRLNTWAEFLENKADVVLLKVSDDANAYRMFETLNDRGLRVSQADLIKNYLYGRAAERLPEVQEKWALIRGVLDNLSDDDSLIDFLRHSLMIASGFVRNAGLYDKVQSVARTPQQVVTLASTFDSLAGLYVAIQNTDHQFWNDYPPSTRRVISVLNLFNIKPIRPVMLAAAAKMSKRECDRAFQFLTSLGVRLLIASSTRTGTVEQALSSTAAKIYSGEITTLAGLRAQVRDITPADSEFKEAFATTRVTTAKYARYYLRALETAVLGESDPWLIPVDDHSVINLEHILPRNPMGQWPQFGSDEDSRTFSSRLGNQALIEATVNSALNSDAFVEKRAAFMGSPYVFTSMVSEFDEWNADSINARQLTMAERAVTTWAI